ncbi:hypothetical protein J4218_01725 [Candidatus Pacearchaeota archaeon]|nr:hypothetical protein [uncultured archaeon]MBS3078817.1 hypothetical protein [Candidatus Pacearchaeota archaeon]
MSTIDILEEKAGQGVQLCPLSANADEIEASIDRPRLIIQHPCYEREVTGIGDNAKVTYVRKDCRGYDTSCPCHSQNTE